MSWKGPQDTRARGPRTSASIGCSISSLAFRSVRRFPRLPQRKPENGRVSRAGARSCAVFLPWNQRMCRLKPGLEQPAIARSRLTVKRSMFTDGFSDLHHPSLRTDHWPERLWNQGCTWLDRAHASDSHVRGNQSGPDGASSRPRGVPASKHDDQYFAHASAFCRSARHIGEGTKIWHFVTSCRARPSAADASWAERLHCQRRPHRHNRQVQNNVSLYTGVELETMFFCGPSCVFTNVVNPRSQGSPPITLYDELWSAEGLRSGERHDRLRRDHRALHASSAPAPWSGGRPRHALMLGVGPAEGWIEPSRLRTGRLPMRRV